MEAAAAGNPVATVTAWRSASFSRLDIVAIPLKSPRVADEWEPYLAEKRAAVDRRTHQLAAAETAINDRLFDLTPDEIALLQREVEH